MNEFDLIRRYFSSHHSPRHEEIILGIGDDAALCRARPGMELAIAVDTLAAGVHFPADTAPEDIGYKALAVNLSDMAAMGAEPAWMTLALTCPCVNETWLAAFSQGLLGLADASGVALIGGDTTRGPLTVTVQITGFVPEGRALTRTGAQAGDGIYVTGALGDAGLALQILKNSQEDNFLKETAGLSQALRQYVQTRLDRPVPRLHEGIALRGIAASAIDVSDGLLADLGHLLTPGNLGAVLMLEKIPLSSALKSLPRETAWPLAAGAGDDYELCFTVPPSREPDLQYALAKCVYTRIGTVETTPGIRCLCTDGQLWQNHCQTGYKHF
ncbi:MAG: thiamine-phosphate kinase [Gammaproteobacteria bacterium]|nr:thiamine-phosphate kinase [Gammaproteobacteria bacterium]